MIRSNVQFTDAEYSVIARFVAMHEGQHCHHRGVRTIDQNIFNEMESDSRAAAELIKMSPANERTFVADTLRKYGAALKAAAPTNQTTWYLKGAVIERTASTNFSLNEVSPESIRSLIYETRDALPKGVLEAILSDQPSRLKAALAQAQGGPRR